MSSEKRFLVLLCLILGMLVMGPILEQFVTLRVMIDIFITIIALSMVSVISNQRRLLKIGAVLASVMILSIWLDNFFPYDAFAVASMIIGVIFTAIVIVHTLTFIIKSETVVKEVIYAAVVVYLLMAQVWAFIYLILYLIDPASFNVPQGQMDLWTFEYFSFVTISTLGYGDITPLTKVAKAFSMLEAIVGQLYLVVVIAWFVGMRVSLKSR